PGRVPAEGTVHCGHRAPAGPAQPGVRPGQPVAAARLVPAAARHRRRAVGRRRTRGVRRRPAGEPRGGARRPVRGHAAPVRLHGPLGGLARIAHDPTSSVHATQAWWATRTPDGPGRLHLERDGRTLAATGYGPGADWLVERADAIAGLRDDVDGFAELAARHE